MALLFVAPVVVPLFPFAWVAFVLAFAFISALLTHGSVCGAIRIATLVIFRNSIRNSLIRFHWSGPVRAGVLPLNVLVPVICPRFV